MNKSQEYEQIGSNDLRFADLSEGGFHHVALRDSDDGDLIIVNEDDIPALIARLQDHVRQHVKGKTETQEQEAVRAALTKVLMEIRKAIQRHEATAADRSLTEFCRRNETFTAAGLRRAESFVLRALVAIPEHQNRGPRTPSELQRAVARFILRSAEVAARMNKIFSQSEALGKDPGTDRELATILAFMEQVLRKCYQEELGTDLPTATERAAQNTEKKGRPITHPLYHADPECEHEHDEDCYSGIRCRKCGGWYCL